jgi:DNA-binding transcriptional ArsR family regulator
MAGSRADRAPEKDAERVRRLSAVFAEPPRLKILSALAAESRLGADTLADRVGEPVHKVRRHLNALLSLGLVEVVDTEGRRGAMKRYYAVNRREARIGGTDYTNLSLQERRRGDIGVLRLIFEEATQAASSPSLGERVDEVVANISERVDEQGWQELSKLHHEMLEHAVEVVAASRARLAASGGEAVGFISQQVLLESPKNVLDAQDEPPEPAPDAAGEAPRSDENVE